MRSIVIALSKIEDSRKLSKMLQSYGLSVDMICKDAGDVLLSVAERDSGVIITSPTLSDMNSVELYDNIPTNFDMIVIEGSRRYEYPEGLISIPSPFKMVDLIGMIETLLASQSRKLKKKKATSNIRTSEDRALLDRAKMFLMRKNDMTEPEAYRYLQKCSMDSATSLVETAEKLILLYG